MLKLSKHIVAVLLAVTLSPKYLHACDLGGPAPSMEELAKAEDTFLNSASLLARISAYKSMLYTRDKDLFSAIVEMGMNSTEKSIRSAALRCKFLTSKSLTVRSLDFPKAKAAMSDLTEMAQDIVQKGLSETYAFHFMDADQNCASINFHHKKQCKPRLSATVSNLTVSFIADRPMNGRFSLNAENRLVGELSVWKSSKYVIVPAEAFLN